MRGGACGLQRRRGSHKFVDRRKTISMAMVCAVWNSLTMAVAGLEPKDDGWVTSEVQRRKAVAVVVMAETMLKNESH